MIEKYEKILARRNSLKDQLEKVEAQLEAYGDVSPVEIATHRNLRNTALIATYETDNMVCVFADREFTEFACESQKRGFVTMEAWIALQADKYFDEYSVWRVG